MNPYNNLKLVDAEFLQDLGFERGTNFPPEEGREVWHWRGCYWVVFYAGQSWKCDKTRVIAEHFANRREFCDHFHDAITDEAADSANAQADSVDY